jgi:RND family efflux transporter MFP subunit
MSPNPENIDMNTDMTTPSQHYPGHVPHNAPHPDAAHALPAPTPSGRPIPKGIIVAVVLAVVIIFLLIGLRFLHRSSEEHTLDNLTVSTAIPTVRTVKPTVSGAASEIALPGNTQAFEDTPIYARTSGYLQRWFVDIGQHVAKGQLMATIETPELDEQLMVARAQLKSAQADLDLANTTSQRYQNLLKSDSVSKQETDVAVSGAAAKQAAVDAAQANVRRLQQLQSFEKIYAPYSGVVTVRNTNVGDLINSGSSTTASAATALYRIADITRLRVFVAVPEIYAADVRNGDTATLTLDEYPGKIFTGKVTRNSSAIDPASRTLNVEVDIDNHDAKLLPGAYVFVHFKIPQQARLYSLPSNALIFRAQGMQVGIVRDGKVHLRRVTIGKDNGATVEIASGVSADDQVILDPSDSLTEGQPVKLASKSAEAK